MKKPVKLQDWLRRLGEARTALTPVEMPFGDSGGKAEFSVPEGHLKVARRFNTGFPTVPEQVPKGRLNAKHASAGPRCFSRPSGTRCLALLVPALKHRAIVNRLFEASASERSEVPRRLDCRAERRRAVAGTPEGFTLIEIMVVVVILGILAATIIPQFIGTAHDAKVGTAKANISELESALERFYIHFDRHPTSDEGMKVLVEPPSSDEKKWRGPYVKMLRPDPWGNPYQYRKPGVHHPTSFDIWSRGADGADGGEGDGADIGNW